MSETLTVALIAAVPSLVAAAVAGWSVYETKRGNRKVDTVSVNINGRITQLLDAVSKEQHAVGLSEGIEQERNR